VAAPLVTAAAAVVFTTAPAFAFGEDAQKQLESAGSKIQDTFGKATEQASRAKDLGDQGIEKVAELDAPEIANRFQSGAEEGLKQGIRKP
jgi:flagellar biosynthesis/type III secretory pathway protein FliH